MDLTPYIEGLQRDLTASAAPGGPEVVRAADLLTGSMEASARLCLLEALSEAAAEITTKLTSATVDVRLRGRQADLTVTELTAVAPAAPAAVPVDSGDLARITLRIPEALKEHVEIAAASEGISVNAWLVRAIAGAIQGRPGPSGPFGPQGPVGPQGPLGPQGTAGPVRVGKRVTGFAQA